MDEQYIAGTAVVIAIVALVFAVPGATTTEQRETISVSGNAEVLASPDKADVLLRVETTSTDVNEAQTQNRQQSDSVMQALRDSGITEDQIQTTDYRIERVRDDPRRQEEKDQPDEYRVVNVIRVETENTQNVGSIIDTGIEAGANGVDAVRFDLSDQHRQEVQNEALEKASDITSQKAGTLAERLGVTVGKPVQITESSYDIVRFESSFDAVKSSGGTAATQISPQDVRVSARITVEYAIK